MAQLANLSKLRCYNMHQTYEPEPGEPPEFIGLDVAVMALQVDQGWVRECCEVMQQTGYLSLADFFDLLDDMNLRSIEQMIELLESSPVVFSQQAQQASKAIQVLVMLLTQGSGVYYSNIVELRTAGENISSYLAWEIHARQHISDKHLREYRKQYSIDKSVDEIVNQYMKGLKK